VIPKLNSTTGNGADYPLPMISAIRGNTTFAQNVREQRMKLSTPSSGQEPEEHLLESERYAINEVCRQVFQAWELEKDPCEWVELLVTLNAGAARAAKTVREYLKPKE
jgi:hypothetical protein